MVFIIIIIIQYLIIISLIGYDISKLKKIRDYKKNLDDYKKNLDEYKNELDDYFRKTLSLKIELDMFKTSVYFVHNLLSKKRKNKNKIKTYKDHSEFLFTQSNKWKFLAERQERKLYDFISKTFY